MPEVTSNVIRYFTRNKIARWASASGNERRMARFVSHLTRELGVRQSAAVRMACARGYIVTSTISDVNLWWHVCRRDSRPFIWVRPWCSRYSWLGIDSDTTGFFLTETGLDRLLDVVRPAHPGHRGCGCGWGIGLLSARIDRDMVPDVTREILRLLQEPGVLTADWRQEAGRPELRRQLRTSPDLVDGRGMAL